jgi:hypothetical protein
MKMRTFLRLLAVAAALACTSALLAGRPAKDPKKWPYDYSKRSPFGVNGHLPSARDFDAMRDAGIDWVRVDFTWDLVEPEPGKYQWERLDRIVAEAEMHKVHILAILGYTPRWASAGPTIHHPPWDTSSWKEFVRAIVSRYRGRITHWTLWNEPNSKRFFKGNVHQYIRQILIPGFRAAKEVDPDCRIVGPDLAHLKGADWDKWLDRILAEGGPYLDVISHHCYKDSPKDLFKELEGPKPFWEPRSVRSIVERNRQGHKPFWLTETGWRSNEVGEQKQAGNLVSFLRGLQTRPWITKAFIFELKDSPQEMGYGLLNVNGTPKHAYTAVAGWMKQAGPDGKM